jgi:hypothetical protein
MDGGNHVALVVEVDGDQVRPAPDSLTAKV